jgi:hypothetical protein
MMKTTSRAIPGKAWSEGCRCREVLIDYVAGTIHHPFYECPHYGNVTLIEDIHPAWDVG